MQAAALMFARSMQTSPHTLSRQDGNARRMENRGMRRRGRNGRRERVSMREYVRGQEHKREIREGARAREAREGEGGERG